MGGRDHNGLISVPEAPDVQERIGCSVDLYGAEHLEKVAARMVAS